MSRIMEPRSVYTILSPNASGLMKLNWDAYLSIHWVGSLRVVK